MAYVSTCVFQCSIRRVLSKRLYEHGSDFQMEGSFDVLELTLRNN